MDLEKLKATDGTGPAVLANITADRLIAATTIEVDSVDNWPNEFIVATGTLDANGFITAASLTEMIGHLDGGNIEIDSFVPGFSDAGNTEGQVAVVKPTGHWATSFAELMQISHNDDGTLKINTVNTDQVVADAINDSKLTYGKVLSRRGGSATDWSVSGANNYDYSATNTVMVCGVSALTAQSTALGFGYTFGQKPIVIATPNGSSGVFSAGWYTVSVSTTGFAFVAQNFNLATPIQWIAIGVPA